MTPEGRGKNVAPASSRQKVCCKQRAYPHPHAGKMPALRFLRGFSALRGVSRQKLARMEAKTVFPPSSISVPLLKIAADADRPSRLRGRFFLESHFVTKSFQTVNKANLYLTSMLLVEVITTKVFIYLFSQQQMVTDHQDAVANCDERPLFPS